LSTKNLSLEAK